MRATKSEGDVVEEGVQLSGCGLLSNRAFVDRFVVVYGEDVLGCGTIATTTTAAARLATGAYSENDNDNGTENNTTTKTTTARRRRQQMNSTMPQSNNTSRNVIQFSKKYRGVCIDSRRPTPLTLTPLASTFTAFAKTATAWRHQVVRGFRPVEA